MALTERLAILVDADAGGAVRGFGAAGKAADGLAKDADNLTKKLADVGGESERTGGLLGRLADKTGTSTTAVKAGLLGLGAAAAGGLAPVGKELFELGADLEQMRAKAETVFGGQIGLVDDWAKKNANAMGLTRNEAVGLSANFADLLIPMGMSREEAAKMSTEVIGLSGALSAWSGGQKSAAEVADILQSAMLGETDSLKSLGISISAADIQARVLANGQSQLTGKAREQAEALAVQQLIMEKSTDAQKAFNDGVQSTNEKMAQQSARFREAKEALATQLTPAVTSAADALSKFVVAGTQATDTSGGLQGIAYKVGAAWADVNADIKETPGLLGRVLDKMNQLNSLNPTFQIGKAIGGLLPGRASGGPVAAGMPYVVGEERPELFVPDHNGTILPSVPGMGGATIIINNNVYMPPGSDGDDVVAALRRWQSGNGPIPIATKG